jgi:hypothetical protein
LKFIKSGFLRWSKLIYKRKFYLFKLVIARNAEECANSMQFYIEEYVDKHSDVEALARRGFNFILISFV